MKTQCPCCFAEYDIFAVLGYDAHSELAAQFRDLHPDLARPLWAYISLFRPKSRALGWDRGLRLAQEALGLSADKTRLSTALTKSVEIFREKQRAGDWKPLSNHNYLKRVLADLPADTTTVAVAQSAAAPRPAFSKAAQSINKLEALRSDRK